jgi:hypothetical protein
MGGGDGVSTNLSVPGDAAWKLGVMGFCLACFSGCDWALPPHHPIRERSPDSLCMPYGQGHSL